MHKKEELTSFLEIASLVVWNGERWTLRNYLLRTNKAALSRAKPDGNVELLSVSLSELEEQNRHA